ncbi:MAG TPA: FKBP-type peptidyl-prolyl cis-trans isomerase [Gammaproteobacteria bacterium]|nr:FKBP-type peptidyl-prolyl cis-trans isomerase [Gammaproteobacteria bacterium]
MQNFTRYTGIFALSLVAVACSNDNAGKNQGALGTLQQKASYSYGVDVAQRLKQQGIELDISALNRGIADAYNGNALVLSDEERLKAKTEFQAQLRDSLVKKQQEIAKKNLEEGKAFLAENAKKPGVITTESGLQYKILATGDGKQPKETDIVTTHYKGTLIDGRVFDSSYDRGKPASFPVNGVIKGWTEALQLMHVGDKWQLFIPSDLAYGPTKRSELIEPNSTLIFEIELLDVKDADQKAERK